MAYCCCDVRLVFFQTDCGDSTFQYFCCSFHSRLEFQNEMKKKLSNWKRLKIFFGRSNHSYFLRWNFDEKSCFAVFFHKWNEWKNTQIKFSSQNCIIHSKHQNISSRYLWEMYWNQDWNFELAFFVYNYLHLGLFFHKIWFT